ncbi:hypothetical protein MJT46_014352 [Ovis ammon polii x Ovis aries]|nr:hypothetical protein MJT46_014351 [Ovis ammon polii x Ovis aries]KAI4555729.1 hypothetical protein MJT46_014352 [Ovis ammon polii x Ovis aries]
MLLRWDGNAQNSFPTKQGKDHSCRARRWKRGSSGCGRDPRASSRVETGFLSLRCQGLKPCVESGPEPEDSSPVLTWIVGYFWSLPRGNGDLYVGKLLELQQMRREHPGFSPEQAANGSLISNYEAETELFWMWAGPTCFLSSGEGAVPRATVVEVHPRREIRGSGAKQVPLEWTETSAGLLECGHDPGVTLAFPVESASSSDAT